MHSPRLVAWYGTSDSSNVVQPQSRETPGSLHASSLSSNKNQKIPNSRYFKGAQWSPDGTSILTSTSDNALETFILPPDLLASTSPQRLDPYSTQPNPEPVYATAFHPSYALQDPASTLYIASLRALPIRLYSPFSQSILASYPLISPTTEEYIAPHSLLFSSQNPSVFFTGSSNLISLFDINRNGEGPAERMPTVPSKRSKTIGSVGGIKGIVSALGLSSEGILAAGTFSRWVGLYDGQGRGGSLGAFQLRDDASEEEEAGSGTGVTQVLWSADGRYLCVAERCSDGISVWDIRGTGKRLAWLRARGGRTNQRLGVEVVGGEVWTGGVDGTVRIWDGLGMKEGVVDPSWEFKAHEDAVSSTTWHFSGSVLASCSGQRHFHDSNIEFDDFDQRASNNASLPTYGSENSLKIWAF